MSYLLASAPKYALVGAAFAVLNMLLIILLDRAGIHYAISILIAAAILIPLSYWPHVKFTYQVNPGFGSFLRYLGAQLVNTPIMITLMFIATEWLAMPVWFATPAALLTLFILNLFSSYWAIVLHRPFKEGRS